MSDHNVFTVRCELCLRHLPPKKLRYVVLNDLLLCIDTKDCTLARNPKAKQATA